MDTKTLNLNFGDGEVEKLREVLRRMGEFIAYFEVAENKMAEWKLQVEENLDAQQKAVNDQLEDIHQATDELRTIMTETGVARWRLAAENSLREGREHLRTIDLVTKQHLTAIDASNEQFAKMAKKSFDRLDRAASYTVKNVSEAIGSFRIHDFQKMTEQSCVAVEATSTSAVKRLKDLVKWFHWKNLGLAAAITIVTSFTMGLYLNDELPWEIHKQVVMQRNAGQALINAWPTLSQSEQQRIIDNSKKSII